MLLQRLLELLRLARSCNMLKVRQTTDSLHRVSSPGGDACFSH